jgi:hypothetical protein
MLYAFVIIYKEWSLLMSGFVSLIKLKAGVKVPSGLQLMCLYTKEVTHTSY